MMTLNTSASTCLQKQLAPLLRLHGDKGWVYQQDYPLQDYPLKESEEVKITKGVPTDEIVRWHVLGE